MVKKSLALTIVCLFFCAVFSSVVLAKSEVYFNKPINKSYAWLNNDAHGDVDFKAKIIELINSAEKTIDICTMSFGGVNDIADALVAAANKGVKVRVICDAGKRFQDGMERILRGPVQVADNNLPALYCKINFQKKDSAIPEGFLADYGDSYGNREGGYTYGWVSSDISNGEIVKSASTEYTTSLLQDVYIIRNTKSAKWQIKLPNGYYYVLVNVGREDAYDNNATYYNYIKVQNEQINTYKDNGVLRYSDYRKTNPGEFSCSIVDGGKTDNVYNSKRVQVTNGILTVTVGGNTTYNTLTALDFIEIYRAKNNPEKDKKYVQNRQLQHSKYIVIDGSDTNKAQLWTGSGNLTAGMMSLSEDAILTDEKDICKAFYKEFNQMWGGSSFVPNSSNSAFGKFKTPMSTTNYSIQSDLLQSTFSWKVHFSPSSTTTATSLNLYSDVSNFINSSNHNLIMVMEQWTKGSDVSSTLRGSTYLHDNILTPYINTGKPFYGIFGKFEFETNENTKISDNIHDKIALSDAYRDTRYTKRGSVLFGSMNWSQSGMHYNDEQTVIIKDPAIANQYLQRAMAVLEEQNIMPSSKTDIVLVLDRSSSMLSKCSGTEDTKLDVMKKSAKMFVDLLSLDENNRISIVRFGSEVEPNKNPDTAVLKALTSNCVEAIKAEIDSIVVSTSTLNPVSRDDRQKHKTNSKVGITANSRISEKIKISGRNSDPISRSTCYGTALQAALNCFENDSNNNRKIVVFFTDGKENKSPMASEIYPDLVNKNIEIHSTAFGNFSPFASESAHAILADMATDSAGTFAQIDTNEDLLKQRFIEIAGDIMNLSCFSTELEFTAKNKKFTLELAEALDSLNVVQLSKIIANMKIKTSKKIITEIAKFQKESSDYRIVGFKSDVSKIKDSLPTIEFKTDQKIAKDSNIKTNLMFLAKAPTTIKAETVANKAGQKDITLLCRILQNNQSIKGANITAEWTTPISCENKKTTTVELYDDGQHGDGDAKDGVFGAKLTLNEAGNHSFHIVATSSEDKKLESIREKIKSKAKLTKFVPKIKRETTIYYTVNQD